MNIKKIVNFIFELGHLKLQPRSGWWFAGVENPESVAAHGFRAPQIGLLIALMEKEKHPEKNINPERIMAMLSIHDNGETRIGDQNKVNVRYFRNKRGAESEAFYDQINDLDQPIKKALEEYFNEFEEGKTADALIAKDADLLEGAFQAKKYLETGHATANDWIENVAGALKTDSARAIIGEMRLAGFADWWHGLKKFD